MPELTSAPAALMPNLRRGVTVSRLAAGLLASATAWLVLRLPGSVIAVFVLAVTTIALAGLHRPRRDSAVLWAFLVTALGTASVATLVNPGEIALVNFATITGVFVAFTAAVLATGLAQTASAAVMMALYYSFSLCLFTGIAEIVTGIKLISILYPEASTLAIENRFLVAAFFPNYNDFAVVVTMFALMVLIRLLTDARTTLVQGARVVSYLLCVGVILGQGSRGALLGLLIGSALVVLQSMRILHPKLVTPPAVILGSLVTVFLGLLIWLSPWVQDHSTATRENIVVNTLSMTPDYSWQFWFGWGDIGSFKQAADTAFPWVLMDPHNIVLEAFVWYGAIATVLFVAVWAYVCWRGVWRLETRPGWIAMSAVILLGLTPVLGIVPSSSLRYYYFFLLAACSTAALVERRKATDGS